MRRRLIDALIIIALMLAVVLLYRKVTRLWWTWDDAFLLHIAAEHSPASYFLSGAVWLWMPQQLFTPLLTASYDAELTLFGPEPKPFYVIHVAELALLAAALYLTLRAWLSRGEAAAAAFLSLAGAPLCPMAAQLMLMHYVESLLLATVSVALFTLAMRRGGYLWEVLSAIAYLGAMLAKEIAVPLPLILLITPEGDVRTRLRRMAPHGVVLLVYLIWRYAILGKLLGGYGWVFTLSELPGLAARTIFRIGKTFAGPVLPVGIALLIVLGVGIALSLRTRRGIVCTAVALVVALVPIFPVMKQYEDRFAVVSWLFAVVVFVAGAQSLRNRRVSAAMTVAACILCVVVNRQAWAEVFPRAMRMSDEGQVFAGLGDGDFLRNPSIPPGSMYQLQWIKENLLHRPPGALWFFDDLYLCTHPRPRRIFGFDEPSRTVKDLTADLQTIAGRHCSSIRDRAPLIAHFHQKDGLLRWNLGPYDRGAYRVVVENGFLAYDVARNDVLQMTGLKSLTVRVRYSSPEGWVTYSPELALDFTREQDVSWRR